MLTSSSDVRFIYFFFKRKTFVCFVYLKLFAAVYESRALIGRPNSLSLSATGSLIGGILARNLNPANGGAPALPMLCSRCSAVAWGR